MMNYKGSILLAALRLLNSIVGNGTRIKDLKAITFFDEINYNEPVKMCNSTKLNWKKIAKRLTEMSKYIDKKFSEPPL